MGEALGEPRRDGVLRQRHHDRHSGRDATRRVDAGSRRDDQLDVQSDELCRERLEAVGLAVGVARLDAQVLACDIAEIAKSFAERSALAEPPVVGFGQRVKIADDRNSAARLRECGERPRRSGAAERRDEGAPPHSITSSALASNIAGISTPSALAVLRLTIVSNFVACSIGMSPGFAPLRNLVDEHGGAAKHSVEVDAVADQAAMGGDDWGRDRRQAALLGDRGDHRGVGEE